jgi:uncharacterized protein (DUF2236 family)
MNSQKTTTGRPAIVASHPLPSLQTNPMQVCPVLRARERAAFSQNQNHIKEALFIGLFVGLTSSVALYNGTGDITFTVIAGVVTGLIAVYLSNKYLNRKKHTELKTQRHALKNHGYFGPGSITWETGVHPSLIYVGLAAGSIQMLHPLVVQLVVNEGKIFTNTDDRVKQTISHGRSTGYGDTDTHDAAVMRFIKQHNLLKGTDEEGKPYFASRPDLLLWVHNSLIWTALQAFEKYRKPKLTPNQEDRYVLEQREYILRVLRKNHELYKQLGEKEKADSLGLIIANLTSAELPTNKKELDAYMVEMLKTKLKSTKDSIFYYKNVFKNEFSLWPSDLISKLIQNTSIRLMKPEHRKLFGIQTSKASDWFVEKTAYLFVQVLEQFFPKEKSIQKTIEILETEPTFGEQFRKNS